MTKEKGITVDKLAEMMNRSFEHLEKTFSTNLNNLEHKVDKMKDEMNEKFKGVEHRLDTIEGKIVNNHENRISRLEDDVRVIKTSREK